MAEVLPTEMQEKQLGSVLYYFALQKFKKNRCVKKIQVLHAHACLRPHSLLFIAESHLLFVTVVPFSYFFFFFLLLLQLKQESLHRRANLFFFSVGVNNRVRVYLCNFSPSNSYSQSLCVLASLIPYYLKVLSTYYYMYCTNTIAYVDYLYSYTTIPGSSYIWHAEERMIIAKLV